MLNLKRVVLTGVTYFTDTSSDGLPGDGLVRYRAAPVTSFVPPRRSRAVTDHPVQATSQTDDDDDSGARLCVCVDSLIFNYPPTGPLSRLFFPVPGGTSSSGRPALSLSVRFRPETSPAVLLGSSGSGKSTLLRCIASGGTGASAGKISINGAGLSLPPSSVPVPRPVLVEEKGPSRGPESTVLGRIAGAALSELAATRPDVRRDGAATEACTELALRYGSLCGLAGADWDASPEDATRSTMHLANLAAAAVRSVAAATCPQTPGGSGGGAPDVRPVILLDEVYDTEVPSVTAVVAAGIARICADGGIVIVATHCPNPFLDTRTARRIIRMSRGTILSDRLL